MSRPLGPHCPTCASPMKRDIRCRWWVCPIGHTLADETIAARAGTRIGRLWLRVFTR